MIEIFNNADIPQAIIFAAAVFGFISLVTIVAYFASDSEYLQQLQMTAREKNERGYFVKLKEIEVEKIKAEVQRVKLQLEELGRESEQPPPDHYRRPNQRAAMLLPVRGPSGGIQPPMPWPLPG